jgi:hypothetical protein
MISPDAIPTVKIVAPVAPGNPDGFTEINESDFDAKVHKLWKGVVTEAKVIATDVKKVAEKVEAEVEKIVEKAEAAAGWGKAPPPGA